MNNIFEKAYFGKAYKTRDGTKAIYWRHGVEHHLLIETGYLLCKDDGLSFNMPNLDIVSEWQEEIDEKELEELAEEYRDTWCHGTAVKLAYKAGYRKAKEN